MKKTFWLAIFFLIVSLFALSACDNANTPPNSNTQQTIVENDDNTNATVCQHTFGDWSTVKQASCKEEGKCTRTCSKCSETEEKSIQKSETHTAVIDVAVPATCKATGLTEGAHCSLCNKVLVAQAAVPATDNHTPVTDAAIPATCKATGLTEGSHCAVCNKVLVAQTVINTLSHTEVVDAAVAPDCENTGLTEGKHCSVCNDVLVAQTVVPKTEDHTTVIDAAVPATCKATGLTEGSHCSVCNEVLVAQTVVPKTDDHTAVTDAAVPASCKSTGFTEGSHCGVCNKVLVAQTIVSKNNDHTSSNWIIDTEATCKVKGEKHKECTKCGEVLETDTIEKLTTHRAGAKDVEIDDGLFCGDSGEYFAIVYCKDCGEKISEANYDLPQKHSMVNDACEICGLPQSTTAGLYFGLTPDKKSYYVMSGREFAGGKVVIGVYNDLSVTEVDFAGCDNLSYIVLGDCVEKIGSFEGCFNLTTAVIGNRIKEIPEYAFRDCSKLSSVTFGDGVEKIGENAFSGCSRLYYVYISGSHDWVCGGNKIYGKWIGKEYGMEHRFADYLKQYHWEWYRE